MCSIYYGSLPLKFGADTITIMRSPSMSDVSYPAKFKYSTPFCGITMPLETFFKISRHFRENDIDHGNFSRFFDGFLVESFFNAGLAQRNLQRSGVIISNAKGEAVIVKEECYGHLFGRDHILQPILDPRFRDFHCCNLNESDSGEADEDDEDYGARQPWRYNPNDYCRDDHSDDCDSDSDCACGCVQVPTTTSSWRCEECAA
jgi:hypothetical protein